MAEKIRIQMNDWLFNAGTVGFMNILEHSRDKFEKGNNYIEFDLSVLDKFEEKYFSFLFDKYGMFTVYGQVVGYEGIVESYLKNMEEFDEKRLNSLNKMIDYVKSKIKRPSYKAAYPYINAELDLMSEEKKLKKVRLNKKQNILDIKNKIQFQLELLKSIIDYMNTKEAKRYLLAKDFIYSFMNEFLKDVAMWGRTGAAKDPYVVYKDHFLESIPAYLEKDKSKYKLNCTSCNRPVKSEKKGSYNLTWIKGTGVDLKKKSSHYWNYVHDTYVCPICNMIYSCIPAGFTSINSKGFFINNNNNITKLYTANRFHIDKETKIEDLETLSYYNVLDSMRQSDISVMDKEIQNIQIIKYDNGNERRPYTFNILSKQMLYVIHKNQNNLKKLLKIRVKVTKDYWINVHQEVLTRLYNNENMFELIGELFKYGVNSYYLYLILIINTDFLGGRMTLGQQEGFNKKVDLSRYFGLQLREAYVTNGNAKKIEGISYRLLNAIKTKNSSRFADVLINAHMYVNKEIPSIFIDTLKDTELLQSYGYGFLLGLQGSSIKKASENKEEN